MVKMVEYILGKETFLNGLNVNLYLIRAVLKFTIKHYLFAYRRNTSINLNLVMWINSIYGRFFKKYEVFKDLIFD